MATEQAAPQAAPTQPAAPAQPMTPEERIAAIRRREPEPPPSDEPAQPERAASLLDADEDATDDGDEPEQRADGEEPEEKAAPAEESDEETIEAASLEDVAEQLGTEFADWYKLTVRATGPDGKPTDVTLSELKDSYQASKKLQSEQRALSEQRKTWEAERQSRISQLDTRLTEAAALAEYAERLYLQDVQGINWDDLRANAPDEWAAKRQEVTERRQQLAAYKNQVMQNLQQHRAEQAQSMQQQAQARLVEEASKLLEVVPEWRDEGKAKAEKAALADYLRGVGFADHDIANASDHRLVAMARKAMLYDQQAKSVNVAKKKVLKVGKSVLKPGAKQTRAEAAQDQMKGLRTNLRKSGRVEDAAALIAARRRRH